MLIFYLDILSFILYLRMKIEMWHGHPDLYLNWLDEISITSDDSDIGYFIEVDLKYLDDIKEKTKIFPFCPKNKTFPRENYKDFMQKKPKNYTKSKK